MKILVSALACNPSWGSEAAVGWSVITTLAQQHEVWVLIHDQSRPPFEEWLKSHTLPNNIHLHFLGALRPFHPNRMLARIHSWIDNYTWQKSLLEPARQLHEKVHFDIVHHVTIATWRVSSPLWQLGIPFVWGPIGGGETFPWQAVHVLSPTALGFEVARSVSNFISMHDPAIRQCVRKAAVCVGGNRETFDLLSRLRGTTQGISKLCVSFFAEEKIRRFRELLPGKNSGGTLKLFAGGNMEGRKGVAIALQALAQVKSKSVEFSYRLGGGGPEFEHLQTLSRQLQIDEGVIFGESLSGDAYQNELLSSHIYLLPSLRDNAPRTLMEAMLAGCVPIVADCGGPGDIVTNECGFRIPVTTPQRMAEEIAEIVLRLNTERGLLESMGQAAHQHIATNYCEESYLKCINAIYRDALKR